MLTKMVICTAVFRYPHINAADSSKVQWQMNIHVYWKTHLYHIISDMLKAKGVQKEVQDVRNFI